MVPRGMGGDSVDPRQVQNRKAMLGEFMKAANIPINDPVNESADGINAPKYDISWGPSSELRSARFRHRLIYGKIAS